MKKKLARALVGLLLLPVCYGVLRSLWALALGFEQVPEGSFYFLMGFVGYLVFQWVFFKPMRSYVFGHELTHAIAAWLTGGEVHDIKVGKKGGSVTVTKPNLFVALAPYVIPFYSMILLGLYFGVNLFYPLGAYWHYFLGILGASLAFHKALTVYALKQDQPDLKSGGKFLSGVIIFLGNAFALVFLLGVLFRGQYPGRLFYDKPKATPSFSAGVWAAEGAISGQIPSPTSMAILKSEIKRKLFHNLALIYLAMYAFLPRWIVLSVLFLSLLVVGAIEFLRLRRPELNAWFLNKFKGINRESEVMHVSGIFWTLLGCWLTMGVFTSRRIVLPALGFLVFGDTAAALGGQKWGVRHWPKSQVKTYIGSLCFAVVSIGWALLFVRWPVAILGGLVGAWIEVLPIPLNDNFSIPVLSGLILSVLNLTLGKH